VRSRVPRRWRRPTATCSVTLRTGSPTAAGAIVATSDDAVQSASVTMRFALVAVARTSCASPAPRIGVATASVVTRVARRPLMSGFRGL
jgi:hypothetical protein